MSIANSPSSPEHDVSGLIVRLKNRAASAKAAGAALPEFALPPEVIALLEEAALALDHQVNVALAWKFTARSKSVELNDLRRTVGAQET